MQWPVKKANQFLALLPCYSRCKRSVASTSLRRRKKTTMGWGGYGKAAPAKGAAKGGYGAGKGYAAAAPAKGGYAAPAKGSWGKGAATGKSWGKSAAPAVTPVWTGKGKGYDKGFGKGKAKGKRGLRDFRIEKRVWLGSVPLEYDFASLKAHMEQAGTVKYVSVKNGEGGAAYATEEEAQNAIAILNGSIFEGVAIEVDVWTKKEA
eukprot:gnl/TRDRNA2_/TRDRNA2_137031_c0_seq1.p1 gnl/TRDRNA2_/TRDRNA2_137031_c0~~gnl/TRDRNA2_/TRDRNA2_137031_c0_seq1.p1  ORF type:complete len:206 (+),score=50.45 gnl/TRDRNA2_/TRDRNA2_137031_c0_seq1:83-700(+)